MKRKICLFLCLIVCMCSVACSEKEKGEGEMYVYYFKTDSNVMLQDICEKKDIAGTLVELENRGILPKGVKVLRYELKNSRLAIYFNDQYREMNKNTEVLLRAAYVQTLAQIEGVEFITFYVDEVPLKNDAGNAVGLMRPDDFIQNTGSSIESYQTTNLTLYFSDKEGKHLKETEKNNVKYNANTSIEKLVVEQLLKGTSSSGSQSTIPSTTKILGVSVKEKICYVNFDSKFAQESLDLDPEVTIYSIVNSIIINGNVTKVQILVDGASDLVYKNSVDLSIPLEYKTDLLKE